MDENTKNIRIYKLIADINIPLASDNNEVIDCEPGDLLISFDGENVYVRDRGLSSLDKELGNNMSLSSMRLSFLQLNTQFFEELT